MKTISWRSFTTCIWWCTLSATKFFEISNRRFYAVLASNFANIASDIFNRERKHYILCILVTVLILLTFRGPCIVIYS